MEGGGGELQQQTKSMHVSIAAIAIKKRAVALIRHSLAFVGLITSSIEQNKYRKHILNVQKS